MSKNKKIIPQFADIEPTKSKIYTQSSSAPINSELPNLVFGKKNFLWMLIGFGIMVLGLFMMMGGKQAPTEWNDSEIYSSRITFFAPLLILVGLGVEFYALFSKKD